MSLMPERRRRRAEVNIVPLVDVLTTLIFFFLVTMQFRQGKTLNITLPEIVTAGKNTLAQSIDISVTGEGDYYLNGTSVKPEELAGALAILGKAEDKPPLVIRADENTPLRKVTFLMDTCRATGFEDFRLQSRNKQ
ncbi:MAG: biopolymer transporter ExbD [Opitutales bacterium]|nr:biopolymer transporter ExbD [Opitutales bacterium]